MKNKKHNVSAIVFYPVIIALALGLSNMALATPVPDTGQTICYDYNQEIPCPWPSEPFFGQDADYTCSPHSYTDLGNGIIRDNVTGLEWQKDTAPGTYTWDAALTYCENMALGGNSDWRLPTIKELSTLVDSSVPYPGPTIDASYFPNTVAASYLAISPSVAWYVDFGYGYVYKNGKTESDRYRVRAVRGGQSNNNFTDNGDGTVTDIDTGLMWQQHTAPEGLLNWQQALAYCENLTLGGHSDWRLPNRAELQTLMNYGMEYPSIDTNYFSSTYDAYWSSTTQANNAVNAWYCGFGDAGGGNIDILTKGSQRAVRAVRGGQCALLHKNFEWTFSYESTSKISAVWGSSGSDIFAVGGNGIILYYDGNSWSAMPSSTTVSLAAVWGSSGMDVFAVGDNIILHYNGIAWSKMALPNGLDLKQASGVWGSSANDVFVGFQDGIIHFDGTSWSIKMYLPVSDNTRTFKAIWGTSSTDVFAIGWYGLTSDAHSSFILHYDGEYWSEVFSVEGLLQSIWGKNGRNVFVVGRGGIIFHYDGTQWSQMKQQWSKKDFYGVWGMTGKNVFVVGEYDQTNILHYDGEEWFPIDSPFQGNLYGIWGNPMRDPILVSPSGDPFAVGDGAILYYTNKTSSTTTSVETSSTTTTSIPSGTTTTTVSPPRCAFSESLADHIAINSIRELRDSLFLNFAGAYLTFTYYRNSDEISSIFEHNPILNKQFNAIISSHIGLVEQLLSGREASVSNSDINAVLLFLDELKSEASPQFQTDLDMVISGIGNRYLLNAIGVRIAE
jgi:hypothetical protein